jgi:hypothetical protein
MYKLLKGKTSLDEHENNFKAKCKVAMEFPENCPYGWFFHGWIASILFGPFAEPEDRLDLLVIGTHSDDGKPSTSRRALRKEEQKD